MEQTVETFFVFLRYIFEAKCTMFGYLSYQKVEFGPIEIWKKLYIMFHLLHGISSCEILLFLPIVCQLLECSFLF